MEPYEVTFLNATNISCHPPSAFLSPSSSPPTTNLPQQGTGSRGSRRRGLRASLTLLTIRGHELLLAGEK